MTEKIELWVKEEGCDEYDKMEVSFKILRNAKKWAAEWKKNWPKDKLQARIIRTEVIDL